MYVSVSLQRKSYAGTGVDRKRKLSQLEYGRAESRLRLRLRDFDKTMCFYLGVAPILGGK